MILVAGGSGFIGRAVVRALVGAGEDVAVMSAHPERSAALIDALGARTVRGDIRDAASLAGAVQGADAVIQALTFPTFPVQKPSRSFTFEEFDHLGSERLVTVAAAAGVRRFVYASGSGAAPDARQVWYRAKWAGEQSILASGLPAAIIRPSWVYGPEDRALNRFLALSRRLPFMPVIGPGTQRLQPVFVDDVGRVLADAAAPDGPSGVFEIGGPEVMTMNQVLTVAMEVSGRLKPVLHVPPALPKAAGFVLQVLREPPISPEAVDFITGDAVADTGPLLMAFPELRLTPLREGLATYVSRR